MNSEFTVEQLHVGGFDHNFSYLLYALNGDAAIIDPCGDTELIHQAFKNARIQLSPKYILLTHGHHDHTSGLSEVREFFDAPVMGHPHIHHERIMPLTDRQHLPFGDSHIEVLFTPGHSQDSVCYRMADDSAVFTGDTLFIDWCGYCNAQQMFRTMRDIIFPLADSNIVYSGHDYGRVPFATLGEEKESNPYLKTTDYNQFLEEVKKL
jgi:glyoxylase-like metal-dependent hydrolase (beta-lactamase superfamily II)